MIFAPRDDLPSAPGLEDLGPLGSLADLEGKVVRIPRSGRLFEPRRAVPVGDIAPLRDAAQLVSRGLVLTNHHAHAAQRELMIEWVEGALGPPRAVCSTGHGEQLLSFEGAIILLLDETFTVACATRAQLRALLSHASASKPSLAPARYSYEARVAGPPFGALLGSVRHPRSVFPEAFELYETESGCGVRGVLEGTFATTFEMKPGGVIATAPRHTERFARATSFGEWQPGLRDQSGLRALLEAHQATDAHADTVLAADDLVGGFRGERGVDLLGPWAASAILRADKSIGSFWTQPRHPFNGAWFIGWAMIAQYRARLYVDEPGSVWASWQDPAADEVEYYRVGESVGRWFDRQLYLLEHGYASEATCSSEGALPAGLRLREDLSDATAKVYEDGDAAWLVEERGIQRMSRHAASVAEVVAIAGRFR